MKKKKKKKENKNKQKGKRIRLKATFKGEGGRAMPLGERKIRAGTDVQT